MRYERQRILPEIGEDGLMKLRSAKVLIAGVGGLGSPIALYLAGAGVGCIGLIDDDVVSLTNLQRQVRLTTSSSISPMQPTPAPCQIEGDGRTQPSPRLLSQPRLTQFHQTVFKEESVCTFVSSVYRFSRTTGADSSRSVGVPFLAAPVHFQPAFKSSLT